MTDSTRTVSQIAKEARDACRNVEVKRQQLTENRQALLEAKAELSNFETKQHELLSPANGRSLNLDNALAAQQKLADLQSQFVRTQAELALALLMLKQATGELVQDKSMWQSSQ